ncbi:kinase-like protein [Coniochaeta sp. PMI_546]|nr:kinase-like protein [Coniochaeta sp. PMI_546]
MDSQLTFRFRVPDEDLPAPLPTLADIKSAQGSDNLDVQSRHTIVRVNSHFVVKYGRNIEFLEGENMVFVRESTNIRVPKLYAMFAEVSTDIRFLVMEYIPGKTLGRRYKELDRNQKQLVAVQLRRYFDELRSLPCPNPAYFGSLDGSGLRHFLFDFVGRDNPFCGPFETEEGINQALADKLRHQSQYSDPGSKKADFIKAALMAVFQGHKAVFTHSDFHCGNFIIQDDGGVAVIDWALAGWYPSHWEYGTAILGCFVNGFADDWHEWVAQILECFYAEWGWFKVLLDNFLITGDSV